MKKKSEPKAKRPSYSSMSSDYCRPETDPSFKVYHELMRFKVLEILLVHTAYDAFIMEGDGTLASRIVTQYHGLNLSEPPRITLATSAGQALALIKKKHFDLVLTMPQVGDMDALSLAARIKRLKPELPVILISHGLTKHLAEEKGEASPLDNYYVWSSDPDLLLTIVKNLEDHKNAARTRKPPRSVCCFWWRIPRFTAPFFCRCCIRKLCVRPRPYSMRALMKNTAC
jgi:CheY-like chemotaxis protein